MLSTRMFAHALAVLGLFLPASAQASSKVRPVPVKTIEEAYYCDDLDMLKARERMVRQRLDEDRQRFDMVMGPFGGQCGRVAANKWVFYTGWSKDGRYVTFRFRFGGSESWVARTSLGELATVLPGRTLPVGNKGAGCKEWEPIARQARERSSALATALQTRSRQQSFLQVTMETAAGIKDSMGACENFTQRLVDYNREDRALVACPKLNVDGRAAELEKLLDTAESYIQNSCLPKQ